MFSKTSLLTSLLLGSAALAAPSLLAGRIARRRGGHPSRPLNRVDALAGTASGVSYSTNWAGAIWNEGHGTFTNVTGTFTVPYPSGQDGSAASAWVGIDGDTCGNAILQTGVDFTVGPNGEAAYDAWFEWYPDYAYDFTSIDISAGHVITTTVVAHNTTFGTAIIENKTTGVVVSQEIISNYALCQQDAEWIVEDFEDNGGLVAFADFGSVTFSDATASGPNGVVYTPSGASITDIEQNGVVLTSVSTNGNTVTVSYV